MAKRHRVTTKKAIETLTRPVIRRMCRKGGCKMVRSCVYDESRHVVDKMLKMIITDAVEYVKHGRRKRIKSIDISAALNRRGFKLYSVHN